MIRITAYGKEVKCSKAIKGSNYIKLYDSEGNQIAAFIGIRDFTGYSIEGGDWSSPEPTTDDYLLDFEYRLSKQELGGVEDDI